MSTPRIRLLPVTATALAAVLALKTLDMLTGASSVAGLSPAYASTEPEADAAPDGHAVDPAHGESGAASEIAATDDIAPLADPASMSASEIQVLQSLARRRAELDARERELDMQAKLIEAAEQRVDARVTELKTIEARISEMLGARDEEAEKQIQALVKVYETMKPKDAARIFEELEEQVLLDVATRMKPAKLAPILAAMKPELAEALTVKLVRRLDMPEMAALSEPAPAPEAAPAPEPVPVTETPIGETLPLETPSEEATPETAPAGPVTDISPAPEPVDEAVTVPQPAPTSEPAGQENAESPAADAGAEVSTEPDAGAGTAAENVTEIVPQADGSPDDTLPLAVDAEPLTITSATPASAEPVSPAPGADAATRAPTGLLPPAPQPESTPTSDPAPNTPPAPAG